MGEPSERREPKRGHRSGPKRRGPGRPPGAPNPGGLGIRPLGGGDFELVHPRAVAELMPDHDEALELWKAGDPEAARDALRDLLGECGTFLAVHVALGRIALEEGDSPLARGHFGYAFELGERALPRGFSGRLPRDRPANLPLYEAAEGLARCYEAMGRPRDAAQVRAQAARWQGTELPHPTRPPPRR